MDEALPAEAGTPREKKRPRLLRVPTSLVVTLVGIALTAWLLPAFTRQWDDRQKAHEFKAALVTDMAIATARALTGGENLLYSPRPTTARPSPARQDWSRESLQIEARLRAYLPAAAIDAWNGYAKIVDNALTVASGNPATDLRGLTTEPTYDPAYHQSRAYENAWSAASKSLLDFVRPYVLFFGGGGLASKIAKYAELERRLLKLNQAIAMEVLRSHLDGYSTTSYGFFRDLIP